MVAALCISSGVTGNKIRVDGKLDELNRGKEEETVLEVTADKQSYRGE